MMTKFIENYLVEIERSVSGLSRQEINRVIEILKEARGSDRFIFLIGNGGSAATASHFAHDLVKSTAREGVPRFKAIALSDNVPIITAVANDHSYDMVFVEQLVALGDTRDLLIAFSGSGNSKNVIKAVEWCREEGLVTIGFTGQAPNLLEKTADLCVRVPSTTMGQIESIHLMLTQLIYKALKDT
jgi:D-sedoheptulose 7-phosphate isomerase